MKKLFHKAAHGKSEALRVAVVGVGARGNDVPVVREARVVLGRRPPVGEATLEEARTEGIGVASEDRVKLSTSTGTGPHTFPFCFCG